MNLQYAVILNKILDYKYYGILTILPLSFNIKIFIMVCTKCGAQTSYQTSICVTTELLPDLYAVFK